MTSSDDKCLMEGLLLLEKGGCDLYMHGTIESSTPGVRSAFDSALSDSLKMQGEIYDSMSKKGWYSAEQAEQTKIDALKTKYSSTVVVA